MIVNLFDTVDSVPKLQDLVIYYSWMSESDPEILNLPEIQETIHKMIMSGKLILETFHPVPEQNYIALPEFICKFS
jgi:hypothetical protein